jgi:hypothetical protein
MIIAAHTMPLRAIPIEFLLWSEPRGRPRSSGRDRLCRLGRFMNPGLVDWGNRPGVRLALILNQPLAACCRSARPTP